MYYCRSGGIADHLLLIVNDITKSFTIWLVGHKYHIPKSRSEAGILKQTSSNAQNPLHQLNGPSLKCDGIVALK